MNNKAGIRSQLVGQQSPLLEELVNLGWSSLHRPALEIMEKGQRHYLCFSEQPPEGKAGSFSIHGTKGINSQLWKDLLPKAAVLFLALNPSINRERQSRQLLAA